MTERTWKIRDQQPDGSWGPEREVTLIITTNIYPPIPLRQFDWQATTDNYEPGCPIGFGATEQQAVADLLEQIEALRECGERHDLEP